MKSSIVPVVTGMRLLKTIGFFSGLTLVCSAAISQTIVTTVIEDHFSGGAVGTSLAGTVPDTTGSSAWKISDSTVFTANGSISAATNGANSEGRIAIAQPAEKILVQASVTTGNAQWVAVGFQSTDASTWWSGNNPVFVRISDGGSWFLHEKGNGATALAQGSISGFSSITAYTLGLEYDSIAKTAAVYINGTQVSSVVALSLADGATLTSAGFRINAGGTTVAGSAQVDDFIVSTIAAVPEPSSVALVMGGLIGLFVACNSRGRRRFR